MIIETDPLSRPKMPPLRKRFSLATLILLTTSVACAAGWLGASRRASRAWLEATALRRANEAYRAELGYLDILDKTKVHAVRWPTQVADADNWKWKLYFPQGRYQFHAYDGPALDSGLRGPIPAQPWGAAVELRGEVELQLELRFDESNQRYLVACELPFASMVRPLNWSSSGDNDDARLRGVVCRQRQVWEPGEQVILVAKERSDPQTKQPSDLFAIWVERLDDKAAP